MTAAASQCEWTPLRKGVHSRLIQVSRGISDPTPVRSVSAGRKSLLLQLHIVDCGGQFHRPFLHSVLIALYSGQATAVQIIEISTVSGVLTALSCPRTRSTVEASVGGYADQPRIHPRPRMWNPVRDPMGQSLLVAYRSCRARGTDRSLLSE